MATNQITGTITGGVTLTGTDTYTNPVTIVGTASISGDTAVLATDERGIQNDGTVDGGTLGIRLMAGGTITNTADGSIYGHDGGITADSGDAPTTVVNQGSIAASNPQDFNAAPNYGIFLGAGGMVTNMAGGYIGGLGGIQAAAVATIVNQGQITAYNTAICLQAGGSVTNAADATIYTYRDEGICLEGSATVDNSGTIKAAFGYGVVMEAGGSVINHAGGTISAYFWGIEASGGDTTINNSGLIQAYGPGARGIRFGYDYNFSLTNQGTGTISGDKYGVEMDGKGTVTNFGRISGGYSAGVMLRDEGTVINAAGGTISGGNDVAAVYIGYFSANNATLDNAGTITSLKGVAADLEGSITNRVIVHAGANFGGTVLTKASADNTLELTDGVTPGTITGIGAKYLNFDSVTIDDGATWTVGGAIAGFAGTTVNGFDAGDSLHLTDLNASGDTVSYDDDTDMLIVKSGGDTIASIHMTGNFTGDYFHLTDDGAGGSYITEDGTPCYCRGTLILTDRGQIAVEDLEIGDRLITASGAARPIRWIGIRSYGGHFAHGNKDVLPVLIRQGALEENVPSRDLWVSPLHAMYLDGVLIPAAPLVNGTSIVQAKRVDKVEYFHLELETHDIIVAEGALSESFIDDDSRSMFHNAADYRTLYPEAMRKAAKYCAPRVEDGFVVEAVRDRLAARAASIRWASAA